MKYDTVQFAFERICIECICRAYVSQETRSVS